jgi:hypothetical protein
MIRAFVSQVPRAVRLNTTGAAAAGGTPRVVRSMKHSTKNIVSDDVIRFVFFLSTAAPSGDLKTVFLEHLKKLRAEAVQEDEQLSKQVEQTVAEVKKQEQAIGKSSKK